MCYDKTGCSITSIDITGLSPSFGLVIVKHYWGMDILYPSLISKPFYVRFSYLCVNINYFQFLSHTCTELVIRWSVSGQCCQKMHISFVYSALLSFYRSPGFWSAQQSSYCHNFIQAKQSFSCNFTSHNLRPTQMFHFKDWLMAHRKTSPEDTVKG